MLSILLLLIKSWGGLSKLRECPFTYSTSVPTDWLTGPTDGVGKGTTRVMHTTWLGTQSRASLSPPRSTLRSRATQFLCTFDDKIVNFLQALLWSARFAETFHIGSVDTRPPSLRFAVCESSCRPEFLSMQNLFLFDLLMDFKSYSTRVSCSFASFRV